MASLLTIVVIITALSDMVVVAEYFDPIHNATVEKTLEGVEALLAQHTKAMEQILTQQTEQLETQLGDLEVAVEQNRQFLCEILDSQERPASVTFLRRQDGSVDFYRNWADYKAGFGDEKGEFWLGLDSLNQLTSCDSYKLHVDLTDWSGQRKWAEYATFRVASEALRFKLTVSGYNSASTAGNSMASSNGMYFTTRDRDNDKWPNNCAADSRKGGWWYSNCGSTNPSGLYKPAGYSGMNGIVWLNAYGDWRSFKDATLKLIKA